jgi:hypothetical protein
MNARTTHRLAAGCMLAAAGLAIAGFTALGSVFDYPAILDEPTSEILAKYRAHQGSVMFWFAMLTVGAALLAPIGLLLGRIAGGRLGRWIAGLGIAAAAVQVIGLSRWSLFVPGVSHDALDPHHTADANRTFERLHHWLGEVVGETIGYALSAIFTVLVVLAITRHVAPRWMTYAGLTAAALIATGVLIPLGLDAASLTNFAGYVLWTLWLIGTAIVLWRWRPAPVASSGAAVATPDATVDPVLSTSR